MSKASSNDGRTFQATLDMICAEYARRGIADIRKVDPPVRVMGTGKHRRVIFLANPWLDYHGVLAGGRAVAIEAKSTSAPTLAIVPQDSKNSGIQHHQHQTAMRLEAMGAAVGYLWHFDGRIRIVTPSMVNAQLLRRKSMRWIDAYPVPAGEGLILADFVACLQTLTSSRTAPTVSPTPNPTPNPTPQPNTP